MQRTLQRGLKVHEASAGTVEDDATVQPVSVGIATGGLPLALPGLVSATWPWANPELAVLSCIPQGWMDYHSSPWWHSVCQGQRLTEIIKEG